MPRQFSSAKSGGEDRWGYLY